MKEMRSMNSMPFHPIFGSFFSFLPSVQRTSGSNQQLESGLGGISLGKWMAWPRDSTEPEDMSSRWVGKSWFP